MGTNVSVHLAPLSRFWNNACEQMMPFHGVLQYECKGGPLHTRHTLHRTGHTRINKQRIAGLRYVRLGLTQA